MCLSPRIPFSIHCYLLSSRHLLFLPSPGPLFRDSLSCFRTGSHLCHLFLPPRPARPCVLPAYPPFPLFVLPPLWFPTCLPHSATCTFITSFLTPLPYKALRHTVSCTCKRPFHGTKTTFSPQCPFPLQTLSDRIWMAHQDVDLVVSPLTSQSINLNLPVHKHNLDINYFTCAMKGTTHYTLVEPRGWMSLFLCPFLKLPSYLLLVEVGATFKFNVLSLHEPRPLLGLLGLCSEALWVQPG